jgi:glycerol uptake facilitator-like aquaporin
MKISKNLHIWIGIILLTGLVLFAYSYQANAFDQILSDPMGATRPDQGINDIGKLVKTIIDLIITVSQVAFIILFLVGGVMYLTSAGNEEQSKKSVKLIIEAVVGLIIVLSAWAVSNWIINSLIS